MKKYKEFFRFLKEIGVYGKYRKYADYRNKFHRECSLKNFLNERNKEDYIEAAFDWSSTKEGHMFWYKIHMWWTCLDGKIPENYKEAFKESLNKLNLNNNRQP